MAKPEEAVAAAKPRVKRPTEYEVGFVDPQGNQQSQVYKQKAQAFAFAAAVEAMGGSINTILQVVQLDHATELAALKGGQEEAASDEEAAS